MKRSRRQDVTTEIVVGAFMFIVLMVLAFFTMMISKSSFFKETYPLLVHFESVGGLKEGENVFMRGMRVGVVDDLEMLNDRSGVLAHIELDRPIRLYPQYRFEVSASSMLGGMQVEIYEGDMRAPPLAPPEYDQLVGAPIGDLLDEATRTIRDIRNALEEGKIIENFQVTMQNVREMSENLNTGTGTVARLLREDTLYREVEGFVTDLNQVGDDIKIISTGLVEGEGLLGKLLAKDDPLYDEVHGITSAILNASTNIQQIAQRVADGEGTLGKLLSEDDALYTSLLATVESLQKFSASLEKEEGTLGRLINDDELYLQAQALVDEVRATIDDFRETSPITSFGSLFFGAF